MDQEVTWAMESCMAEPQGWRSLGTWDIAALPPWTADMRKKYSKTKAQTSALCKLLLIYYHSKLNLTVAEN